jgi:hypothetical protein
MPSKYKCNQVYIQVQSGSTVSNCNLLQFLARKHFGALFWPLSFGAKPFWRKTFFGAKHFGAKPFWCETFLAQSILARKLFWRANFLARTLTTSPHMIHFNISASSVYKVVIVLILFSDKLDLKTVASCLDYWATYFILNKLEIFIGLTQDQRPML